MTLKRVTLKSGRERSVVKLHPWIFSGAIDGTSGPVSDGEYVEVFSKGGEFLAGGLWNEGGIAVKILRYVRGAPDPEFWRDSIGRAWELRKTLGLTSKPGLNAFRLVNAEGDRIPGLIVDLYGETAVVQSHSKGIYLNRAEIVSGLREVLGDRLKGVFLKGAGSSSGEESAGKGEWLWGGSEDQIIGEGGRRFFVDWATGQKTGFFLDQRENREILAKFSEGQKILNAFCYTGGFSIYALTAGAREVVSLDSSKPALDLLEKNIGLNPAGGKHTSVCRDYFSYIGESADLFDVIVLDPPAFAKHRNAVDGAKRGYTKINQQAFARLRPGGFLFTFSCSQLISREVFAQCVSEGAAAAGRSARVVMDMHQAMCHPRSLHHPEGEYLKGFVVQNRIL